MTMSAQGGCHHVAAAAPLNPAGVSSRPHSYALYHPRRGLMHGLSTFSRMMQRPVPASGSNPAPLPPTAQPTAHASALAAASAVGEDEVGATSPISPLVSPGSAAGYGSGSAGIPLFRGLPEGRPTLGMRPGPAGRPTLGPRNGSAGHIPPGNTGLAGAGGMQPTLESPEGMHPKAKVGGGVP